MSRRVLLSSFVRFSLPAITKKATQYQHWIQEVVHHIVFCIAATATPWQSKWHLYFPISQGRRSYGSLHGFSVYERSIGTMQIKCKRIHLNISFVALLILFAVTSIILHAEHRQRHRQLSTPSEERSLTLRKQSIATIYNGTAKKARILTTYNNSENTNQSVVEYRFDPESTHKESVNTTILYPQKYRRNDEKDKQDTTKTKQRTHERGIKTKQVNSTPSSKKAIRPMDSSMGPNATFAACLLLRDDNSILPGTSWLKRTSLELHHGFTSSSLSSL
jgi:hypothetical protein